MKTEDLTPEEWQNIRVKIANLVARKEELEKICCICGKEGKILHNRENPYLISFICDDCRKDVVKVKEAQEQRIDIRTKLQKESLHISTFYSRDKIKLVDGYLNMNVSIGDYCEKRGISRYQFGRLVHFYDLELPEMEIKKKVKEKSNQIMRDKSRGLI